MKKCLVISNGPVPTPEHVAVEGGGLRCWGLSKGIHDNNKDIELTVAYERSYKKPNFTKAFEGINITTWTLGEVPTLISEYDTIIVSYCMGDLSTVVAESIRSDQQLILDCYVPIYVEVSARESARLEEEFAAFEIDVNKWRHVLRRGDLFLCANEAQKDFYRGVLSAVGRLNPVTYKENLILITPYGVYRDEPKQVSTPISDLIEEDGKYLKVLWFGGIYPWFDVRSLADAIKEVNSKIPAKLIVVGAKNPFNNHPDFVERYEEFIKYVSTKEMKKYVIIQDWINFNDRADWYLDSDIVVVFNKIGEENKLAWRTRLVDFMWADLPVLTNGGDPLGELMLQNNAAVRMPSTEAKDVASTIIEVLGKDRQKISELKTRMHELKSNFFWDVVTRDLSQEIERGSLAKDLHFKGRSNPAESLDGSSSRFTMYEVFSKAKKVPAYAKKYGIKTTGLVVGEMVRRKLSSKDILPSRSDPAYVFISHQLDMSGAPFIAIDMAIEFKNSGRQVEFYTYLPIHEKNITTLKNAGIKPRILMKKEMVPEFTNGDTVILNTVAHSEALKEALFHAAETNKLSKILWYLHEDDPELLFRKDERSRIKSLLKDSKMKLLIAAYKMRKNYVTFFDTEKNIELLPYRHVVPKKYHKIREASDFSKKLTFVLPGTVGDGRKGQMPIYYAFVQFYNHFYKMKPDDYRDFELVLVGLSDDFISRQLRAHSPALKNHFSYHSKVTWDEVLDIAAKGNVTICYSIRECLPLFVFEGMVSGHVLLRNDSSGMEEQLKRNENGFYLESDDYEQVVSTIESILNKSKTSDKELAKMSAESYKIAKLQEDNSYLKCLDEGI